MERIIHIILTKEHIEQLNKKKKVTFNVKSSIIQIEALHPIEIAPINEIHENKDKLLKELEYLREYVKILESREPTIEEYDNVIRICWFPGIINKRVKKGTVELCYNKNGMLLGIEIPKKIN